MQNDATDRTKTQTMDADSQAAGKPFPTNLTVAVKIIGGLGLSTLICGFMGLAGVVFMSRINDRLVEITDTAEPLVTHSLALVASVERANTLAEEIAGSQSLEEIDGIRAEFSELRSRFLDRTESLFGAAAGLGIDDKKVALQEQHENFYRSSKAMFDSRQEALRKEDNAEAQLAAFDETGAQLIVALDEFAVENEAEMAKAEEEGDRLEREGASGAKVNAVLGALFDQDYPVVESALKLQRLVFEIQDTAGEYLAEEDEANLQNIRDDYDRLYDQADALIDVLKQFAESQEDKDDAETLDRLFETWVGSAKGEGSLFDSHTDMLRAFAYVHMTTEELELSVDSIVANISEMERFAEDFSNQRKFAAEVAVNQGMTLILALIIAALLIAAAMIVITIKSVTRPLKRIAETMIQLSGGTNDLTVEGTNRADEIGEMARSVDVFRLAAIEKAALDEKEKEAARVQRQRTKRMEQLIAEFESVSNKVVEAVGSSAKQLHTNAASLSSSAVQVNSQSVSVASRSEEAAVNVQTVAASSEELSQSISEIARQIDQSSVIAGDAAEKAQATTETMRNLRSASQQIGDAVSLITDIADQTNLLALNATIEAARAGDAGKGFSVVATEVKSLANQTASATDAIRNQVTNIQSISDQAAEAIDRIADTIEGMNEISAAISAAMEQQRAATAEISRNVAEASDRASEVNKNIAGVSEGAKQTEVAASDVLSEANTLSENAATMSTSVDQFLEGIRTA